MFNTVQLVVSLYTSPVFAGFLQMQRGLEMLSENAGIPRAVTELMGSTLDQINNYGCWCYFESKHGHGKSKPVNDVDALCKILHEGYDCAMVDAEANGDSCVPWEVDYNTGTANLDNLVETCTVKNQNTGDQTDCATNSCIVEGYFITNVFQLFISGTSQHNLTYSAFGSYMTKK